MRNNELICVHFGTLFSIVITGFHRLLHFSCIPLIHSTKFNLPVGRGRCIRVSVPFRIYGRRLSVESNWRMINRRVGRERINQVSSCQLSARWVYQGKIPSYHGIFREIDVNYLFIFTCLDSLCRIDFAS